MADIEFKIGDTGTYTLKFHSKGVVVDVSGYSGGTIVFAKSETPSTSVASASLNNIGTTNTDEAEFTIPTTGFAVGDDEYTDYEAQVELTGAGTRGSFIFSCRVYKKLGSST